MSGTETMTEVFEKLAERTYGEDRAGDEMTTIQRWHFISQVGIEEPEFDQMVEQAEDWIADADADINDPAKIQAGFALYALAQTTQGSDESNGHDDPMYY